MALVETGRGTASHRSRIGDHQGFQLQFICKRGPPRGSTPARGPSHTALFLHGGPGPSLPLSCSPALQGVHSGHYLSSLLLEDTHFLEYWTHQHTRGHAGMHLKNSLYPYNTLSPTPAQCRCGEGRPCPSDHHPGGHGDDGAAVWLPPLPPPLGIRFWIFWRCPLSAPESSPSWGSRGRQKGRSANPGRPPAKWVSAEGSWLAPLLPPPMESSSFSRGVLPAGRAEVVWLPMWHSSCRALPTRQRCQQRSSSDCTWGGGQVGPVVGPASPTSQDPQSPGLGGLHGALGTDQDGLRYHRMLGSVAF